MLRIKKSRTVDGARRSDIWIIKSLPELSSGETKKRNLVLINSDTHQKNKTKKTLTE